MSTGLASDTRLPLYQRLRDDLARNIEDRTWKPGEAIPSELDLARAYGVALGTMRKALDLLESERLVERIHGKGTFVRRANFNASLFRFFRFQGPMGDRHVPESRILGRKVLPANARVASELRLEEGEGVIHLSRLRLLEGAPALAEEIYLPLAKFSPLAGLPLSDFGNLWYPLYEEVCGHIVASAEETLTAELAEPAEAKLLGIATGAPVVVIERLAFDIARNPLEWRRSKGPADQFKYHVEIR